MTYSFLIQPSYILASFQGLPPLSSYRSIFHLFPLPASDSFTDRLYLCSCWLVCISTPTYLFPALTSRFLSWYHTLHPEAGGSKVLQNIGILL